MRGQISKQIVLIILAILLFLTFMGVFVYKHFKGVLPE